MGAMDYQFMVADESTYGTAVTVTKGFEIDPSSDIKDAFGRTESNGLRVGNYRNRDDRFTPYYMGASGTVQMDVLSKGYGYWLKHMLGTVATTGPTDTVVYTHTGTEADLLGKSFTAQIVKPFNPAGTAQAFTYKGGKITAWTLSNSVDGNLVMSLDLDFVQSTTATAVATASYPASTEPLTWAGGVVTIGGSAYDVDEIEITSPNGLNVDRRQIRGNTDKKEPTGGYRDDGTVTISADMDTLAQRNRAVALTRAGTIATIVGTWTAPTGIGASSFPQMIATATAVRFDEWEAAPDQAGNPKQTFKGKILTPAAGGSPITLAYKSVDTTP